VQNATRQVKKLTGVEDLNPAFGSHFDLPLKTLNGDFARDLVWRHRPASREYEADDFEFIGLEQRDRSCTWQLRTERTNIDWLT
jgi:hypothetical protein